MGTRMEVTGVLSNYNGQLQISPVLSFEIITTGIDLMQPWATTIDYPNNHLLESMIVSFPCLGIFTCKSEFEAGWFTAFDNKGNSIKMYVDENNFNIGTAIPTEPIYAAGILVNQNNRYHLLLQYFFQSFENDCYVIDRGEYLAES